MPAVTLIGREEKLELGRDKLASYLIVIVTATSFFLTDHFTIIEP